MDHLETACLFWRLATQRIIDGPPHNIVCGQPVRPGPFTIRILDSEMCRSVAIRRASRDHPGRHFEEWPHDSLMHGCASHNIAFIRPTWLANAVAYNCHQVGFSERLELGDIQQLAIQCIMCAPSAYRAANLASSACSPHFLNEPS